jgi:hypothetical protein
MGISRTRASRPMAENRRSIRLNSRTVSARGQLLKSPPDLWTPACQPELFPDRIHDGRIGAAFLDASAGVGPPVQVKVEFAFEAGAALSSSKLRSRPQVAARIIASLGKRIDSTYFDSRLWLAQGVRIARGVYSQGLRAGTPVPLTSLSFLVTSIRS